jgi:cell division septal protein FtsQ
MISPRKNTVRKNIFLVAYAVFLVALLAAGLLLSPLFKIKTVEIYGAKKINPEEIRANIEYKNILFVTVGGLKENLMKKFPEISRLEIEKIVLKKIIKITLTEREELGIVCKAGEKDKEEIIKNCFYIDKEGVIFKNAPQTSGS